jgi:site-specific recombinase XerD
MVSTPKSDNIIPHGGAAKPYLLDQVREKLRYRHYSLRTERAYVDWIRRFILFHQKRHPTEMGAVEIEAFLTHLAIERHVSASTQNQALSALLFLYKEVLQVELPWLGTMERAKKPQRLPTVLTVREVNAVLGKLAGTIGLMERLLYGTGMRLMECVRLRVKQVARVQHSGTPDFVGSLGIAVGYPNIL